MAGALVVNSKSCRFCRAWKKERSSWRMGKLKANWEKLLLNRKKDQQKGIPATDGMPGPQTVIIPGADQVGIQIVTGGGSHEAQL